MAPGISVVIPTLNAAATLGEQLDAVLRQECSVEFEVIVADNGSSDDTRTVAEEHRRRDPRIRVVDASGVPLGGAAAKNLGVRSACGALIACCDADDLIAPGWLQALVDGLGSHHAVIARIERWHLNPRLREAITEFAPQYAFGGVPVVPGGAFGIHRDLYLEVGGFDETLGGPVDDEFGIRLFRHTRAAPATMDSAVVHVRLPTTSKASFRRARAAGRVRPEIVRRHSDILHRSSGRILVATTFWLVRHTPGAIVGRGRQRWFERLGGVVGECEGWTHQWWRRVHPTRVREASA